MSGAYQIPPRDESISIRDKGRKLAERYKSKNGIERNLAPIPEDQTAM